MLPISGHKSDIEHGPTRLSEVIDATELARRWNLPVSWIREQTRSRAGDPLPCIHFGRYVRFEWGSPQLAAWFERRRT
jgi:hypothetical protein